MRSYLLCIRSYLLCIRRLGWSLMIGCWIAVTKRDGMDPKCEDQVRHFLKCTNSNNITCLFRLPLHTHDNGISWIYFFYSFWLSSVLQRKGEECPAGYEVKGVLRGMPKWDLLGIAMAVIYAALYMQRDNDIWQYVHGIGCNFWKSKSSPDPSINQLWQKIAHTPPLRTSLIADAFFLYWRHSVVHAQVLVGMLDLTRQKRNSVPAIYPRPCPNWIFVAWQEDIPCSRWVRPV